MARDVRIALDAMGGDHGPSVVLSAAGIALERRPDIEFLIYGDEKQTGPIMSADRRLAARSKLFHTSVAVQMTDKPSQALRTGRRVSSMWQAIEAVKSGAADCAVSAGNTGALMAMSKYHLGVLDGIDRPAIAALWPTKRGQSVVLDVGANVECDAQQLVDFAIMGEAFARAVLGLERPTVGILNIGAEDVKGNDAVKSAAHMLRNVKLPIEFCGFVEGDDIAEGTVDVIVTDGFTGNVALKTAEGTAKLVAHFLRSALKRSFFGTLGAILASGALGTLKRKLDPRSANGGIFLGLNGVVVKSHGGTDALGFASALDMAIGMADAQVIPKIVADRAIALPPPVQTAGAVAS